MPAANSSSCASDPPHVTKGGDAALNQNKETENTRERFQCRLAGTALSTIKQLVKTQSSDMNGSCHELKLILGFIQAISALNLVE